MIYTVNFLTKTFNYIILPSFESQEIVKKNKIRCVNRDLLQLKHYLFQKDYKRNLILEIVLWTYVQRNIHLKRVVTVVL